EMQGNEAGDGPGDAAGEHAEKDRIVELRQGTDQGGQQHVHRSDIARLRLLCPQTSVAWARTEVNSEETDHEDRTYRGSALRRRLAHLLVPEGHHRRWDRRLVGI